MLTEFQEQVYNILKKVPKGKVTTYGDLAKALNFKPLTSRAIGTAMNKNPHPGTHKNQVPCHRVIKYSGEVGGFAHGTKRKIKMLKSEDIKINKNKIDLVKYRFNFKKK
ncbi:MAG: MGMT family protein [Candidatus Pacearchaeota archaeon]